MRITSHALLAMSALLALSACGKSSSPAEDSELTVMNEIGRIEGTINDSSAIATPPAPSDVPPTASGDDARRMGNTATR
jgi:ABC-type glycerol-3-phosphate transport system substrate-binding protein